VSSLKKFTFAFSSADELLVRVWWTDEIIKFGELANHQRSKARCSLQTCCFSSKSQRVNCQRQLGSKIEAKPRTFWPVKFGERANEMSLSQCCASSAWHQTFDLPLEGRCSAVNTS